MKIWEQYMLTKEKAKRTRTRRCRRTGLESDENDTKKLEAARNVFFKLERVDNERLFRGVSH